MVWTGGAAGAVKPQRCRKYKGRSRTAPDRRRVPAGRYLFTSSHPKP